MNNVVENNNERSCVPAHRIDSIVDPVCNSFLE